ncbi:DUF2905 domain-containing protein [Oceanithermus sp.]
MDTLGRLLILLGLLLALVGALLVWLPGALSWFGHLPGDVRIERDGVRVFAPITSMLLVSLGLTLLFNLLAWWLGGHGR